MAGFASGSSEQKLTKKILLERNKNLNSAADNFIEDLENVQQVIDILDSDESEKQARVLMLYERSKKPIFDRRNNLAKNIPNFWIKSLERHPDICTLIDRETEECFRFLDRLEVLCTEKTPPKFAFKINFFFNENPYFENDVLTKEVVVNNDDTVWSTNTQIIWKSEKKNRGKTTLPSRKRKWEPSTFFEWFVSNCKSDMFAGCFRKLHQHPLRYFYRPHDYESDSCYDEETDSNEDTEEEGMNV